MTGKAQLFYFRLLGGGVGHAGEVLCRSGHVIELCDYAYGLPGRHFLTSRSAACMDTENPFFSPTTHASKVIRSASFGNPVDYNSCILLAMIGMIFFFGTIHCVGGAGDCGKWKP